MGGKVLCTVENGRQEIAIIKKEMVKEKHTFFLF